MTKWTPADVVAGLIIVGCIILLALGYDGDIKGILGAGGGYVFARAQVGRQQRDSGG